MSCLIFSNSQSLRKFWFYFQKLSTMWVRRKNGGNNIRLSKLWCFQTQLRRIESRQSHESWLQRNLWNFTRWIWSYIIIINKLWETTGVILSKKSNTQTPPHVATASFELNEARWVVLFWPYFIGPIMFEGLRVEGLKKIFRKFFDYSYLLFSL